MSESYSKQNSSTFKSGYSLLEILVVMIIIGVLLFLLVNGFIAFRKTFELQQNTSQVSAILKQTRTFSDNNILPDSIANDPVDADALYGYRLDFRDNTIRRSICRRLDIGWSECILEENLMSKKSGQIVFDVTECPMILFTNFSGDILTSSDNGVTYRDVGVCEIKVRHSQSDENDIYRIIKIDTKLNTYRIEVP